jgi:histidinol-phosphate aminotransferase
MFSHIKPAAHGALDYAELERHGLNPDDVLDFSVNSNPYGPSPLILEAIQSVPIERYPDREAIALRRALSEQLDVSTEQILVGNGTAELIHLTAFAFLQKKSHVLFLDPTFGEYERSARLMVMGANIHHCRALAKNGFVYSLEEIHARLSGRRMHVVFICNPNNPTGQVISREMLGQWSDQFRETLFIVDEAYLAFVEGTQSTISLKRKNILVLRSMTKDYAIAGLRLGYAVGESKLIDAMKNFRPAWNVNALAQAAGLAALQSKDYLSETFTKLRSDKENLVTGLQELNFEPVPSHTNYFLLPVGNGSQFRAALLQYGMIVRDCASFGLPSYVRIATRTRDENLRLLNAISIVKKTRDNNDS